jgi:hypothetical protein
VAAADTVEWFGGFTPNFLVTVNPQSAPSPSHEPRSNPNSEPDPNARIADVHWIVMNQLGTPR